VKRLSIMLLSVSLVAVLAAPAVHANVATVTLALNHSNVALGQVVELTVTVDNVDDLYGSSIDIYYDSSLLTPIVPQDMEQAAATWFVAAGSSGYFADKPSSDGQPKRQSIIVLRTGPQPGVSGSGVIGKLQFTTVSTGTTTFTVGAPPSAPQPGDVGVELVDSVGANLPFVPGTSSPALTVGDVQGLAIVTPTAGARVESSDFDIVGTSHPSDNVTVSLDSGTVKLVTADAAGAWTARFTNVPEGLRSATLAGAGTTPSPRTFWVDLTNPTIAIDEIVAGINLAVTGTVTDPNGIAQVAVFEGTSPAAGDIQEVPAGAASYGFSQFFLNVGVGPHTYTVWTKDRSGRENSAQKSVSVITAGSIEGHVTLLMRDSHQGVKVTAKGNGVTAEAITDTNGHFAFDAGSLPPGTYLLEVTRPSYLSVIVHDVPVWVGSTTNLDGETATHDGETYSAHAVALTPGNIVDNNTSLDSVYLEDLAAMARAFDRTGSLAAFTPTYNFRADLDGNGSVGISDLGILATNWAMGGALQQQVEPTPGSHLYLMPQ